MPSIIDDAIVKMRFDNQDFENNVSKSMSTLDKLKQSLNFKGSSEGLNNLGSKIKGLPLNGLSSAVETVGRRFSAMEVIGVTALANITNSVVNTGKQMLSSLTVAPIKQGFGEYELKMGSVQTIMASTGASLKEVNGYLNELNTYADKTIYSFSDMTNSIGKFTNAGVSLKDAVAAIQGISNAAALSGSNAQQASHAMYNFAQALSSGYVKLIDWKSIEIAGMATVDFKKQLLDTAVKMKTVTKTADGMYKTLTTNAKGQVSEAFDSVHGFNDALSYQWMTTEVLTKTLAKYANAETDLGKKAFAAAQDIKTFTQLMDTLQEAVGSGWAQTFELIFGDFNEAKKLWTSLNNVISPFIDNMSDARNAALKTWRDLGGRKALIDGLTNAFHALVAAVKPVKHGFEVAFKNVNFSGKRLAGLSEEFKNFTKSLEKFAKGNANKIFNGFKGIGAIFYTVWNGLHSFVDGFKDAFGDKFVDTLSLIIDKFSEFGKAVYEYLNPSDTPIKDMVDLGKAFGDALSAAIDIVVASCTTLKNVLDGIKPAFESVFSGVSNFVTKIGESAEAFDKAFSKKMKEGIEGVHDGLTGLSKFKMSGNTGGFKILTVLTAILQGISAAATAAFSNIAKLVGAIGDFAADNLNWGAISDILTLLNTALLSGIIKDLKDFDLAKALKSKDILKLPETFKAITKNIADIPKSFNGVLGSVTDTLEQTQKKLKADTMNSIANALLKIAAAVILLASVDVDSLAQATAALGVLVAILTKAVSSLGLVESAMEGVGSGAEAAGKGAKKGAKGIKGFLGGLLGGAASNTVAVATLNALAFAIVQLSAALFLLSKADPERLAAGLVAMQGLIHMLQRTLAVLSAEALVSLGAGVKTLTAISKAIERLAIALLIMSFIKPEQLLAEVGAISALAFVLSKFIASLDVTKAVAFAQIGTSLTALSFALIELSLAMKIVASMKWEDLLKSIVGLAGGLGILVAALYALKPLSGSSLGGAAAAIAILSVSMIALAAAMAIMGHMSWEAWAKGLLGLAIALGTLVGALVVLGNFGGLMLAAAAAIAIMALALNMLLPVIVTLGTLPFAVIVGGLVGLAVALGIMIAAGAAASVVAAPLMALSLSMLAMAGAIFLFSAALVILSSEIGVIGAIGSSLIIIFLDLLVTISKAAPKIVKAVVDIVNNVLKALTDSIPDLVKNVSVLLISVMDELANYLPKLMDSAVKLVVAVIEGTATAIEDHREEILDAIEHIIVAVFKLLGGLGERLYNLINKATDGGLDAIMEKVADFIVAGEDVVRGIIQGIKSKINAVREAIGNVASSIKNWFKKLLGIHSPSRVMMSYAGFMMDGLVIGMKKGTPEVIDQTTATVGAMLDAMTKTIKGKMKYGRGAFQEMIDMFKPSVKSAKDADNAIKAATNSLKAFVLQQYQQSDAYKQDKENIKKAKKDIKDLNKELAKAKKSRKKGRSKEIKDIKSKLKEARKALKDTKKEVETNIKQISKDLHAGLADNLKSFMDPLALSLNESSPYDEFVVPTYDEINKVKELEEQYASLNEQYAALDESQQNTRAAHNLLDQIDEISAKLDEARSKMGNTLTPEQLMKNMESQATAESTFQENLKHAAERGLSPDIIADLKKQGKEANSTLVAFLEMSDEQIERSNKAFSKKAASDATAFLNAYLDQTEAAKKWAADMKTLGEKGLSQGLLMALGDAGPESQATVDKLLTMTSEEFEKFSKKYDANLKLDDKLADQVIASYALAGVNCAKGFADGLISSEGLSATGKAAEKLAKKVVKQVNKYLGIHSPSRVFREIGLYSDAGLAEGFEDGSDSLTARVLKMLSGLESDIANKLASLGEDESTEFKITPVIDDQGRAQAWVDEFRSNMQDTASITNGWGSSSLAGNISSNFTYKAGDDFASMANEIKRLNSALKLALDEDRINQTNEFHIESNDPQGVADEVSRILQRQVERRSATWA